MSILVHVTHCPLCVQKGLEHRIYLQALLVLLHEALAYSCNRATAFCSCLSRTPLNVSQRLVIRLVLNKFTWVEPSDILKLQKVKINYIDRYPYEVTVKISLEQIFSLK